MKKKIALIAVIMIIGSICVAAFAGCSTKLDNADAFDVLSKALDESYKAETYYLSYSKDSKVYSLNVLADDSKTTLDDFKAQYTYVVKGSIMDDYTHYYFGQSLASDAKKVAKKEKRKIRDSDYKKLYFFSEGEGDNKITKYEDCTKEDFLAKEMINQRTPEVMLKDLAALTFDKVEIAKDGFYKQGRVVYLKMKAKEGIYAEYPYIEIQITNGKIASVIDCGEDIDYKPKFTLFITYHGPNMILPNYDKCTAA